MKQFRTSFFLLFAVLLAACSTTVDTPEPTTPPTPLPFGTVQVDPTEVRAANQITPTPRPTTCAFPLDLDGTGNIVEAAVYRFEWVQGETVQTVAIRGGSIELQGPATLPTGERQLVIVHRGPTPARFVLSDSFTSGATLLHDPVVIAFEVYDESGALLQQILSDPPEDVRGLPANLDILSVERQFGAEGGYTIRVTTAAADDGEYLWSFESIEALMGEERYAARTLADGEVLNGYYDADGQFSEWDGTMIKQGATVTWVFEDTPALPFSARSNTSAANGDETSLFPVDLMARLWEASRAGCG